MPEYNIQKSKGTMIIWNKDKTIIKRKTYVITNYTLNYKIAEKIFKVNLKNRHFTIQKGLREVTISFFDNNNCFGWLERLEFKEFNQRLKLYA